MFCERRSLQSSSIERPKRSETAVWMRSIETSGASPCGNTSLSTSWASSTVIGRAVRLENARLDVGDQPPLESGAQALLERGDLPRRAVRGDDDLPAGLVERVEGVEELLLDPLLVLEELDVVDQEQVVGAVALLEALDPLVPQRVDEVVHEGLARHVAHRELALVLADVLRDRLQEVGLAEPGAAVDEERVVRLRRRLGDGQRGRVCEAVRRADHERVERVLRVEPSRHHLTR